VFRPTIRLRLTLLYGGLFLALGAVLLIVNWFLVRRSITVRPAVLRQRIELRLGRSLFSFQAPPLSATRRLEHLLNEAAADLRREALHNLVVQSATAFAAMAVVSLGLGWVLAARVLRPLQQITATARRLSEKTLHERIDLQGPKDELKELADTFDEMLERLDAAFDGQRRFVANASHELRTPLSIIKAELDVTLSSPEVTPDDYAAMAEVVREASDRSERLIESLLTLARSESAMTDHVVDLGEVGERMVEAARREGSRRGVRLTASLERATLRGDEVLLERLVENLLENAVRYNRAGGWVEVSISAEGPRVVLRVRNSGEVISAGDVESLFEPFRRLGPDRIRSGRGVGLGLAIVRAVAKAHGGSVAATASGDGGLDVLVDLPAAAAADQADTAARAVPSTSAGG